MPENTVERLYRELEEFPQKMYTTADNLTTAYNMLEEAKERLLRREDDLLMRKGEEAVMTESNERKRDAQMRLFTAPERHEVACRERLVRVIRAQAENERDQFRSLLARAQFVQSFPGFLQDESRPNARPEFVTSDGERVP